MPANRSADADTLRQGAARRRWKSCTVRPLAATCCNLPVTFTLDGMKPTYLGIEAAVCALPSIVVGCVGAFIFLASGISMLGYQPAEGAKGIAIAFGIVVALLQYMTLAARTIFGEPYVFGIMFWVAVFFGCLGIWYAFNFFGAALGAFIAGPISALRCTSFGFR